MISGRTLVMLLLLSGGIVAFRASSIVRGQSTGKMLSEGQIKRLDPDCGPNSALIICKLLDVKASRSELARLAHQNERGTTMYGLLRALQGKGLGVVGVNAGFQRLRKINRYGIAYVEKNHFVVLAGFVNDKARIIDFPRKPFLVSQEEFEKMCHGDVLLISNDIIIDSTSFIPDLDTPSGTAHIFLRNISSNDFRIKAVYARDQQVKQLSNKRNKTVLSYSLVPNVIKPRAVSDLRVRLPASITDERTSCEFETSLRMRWRVEIDCRPSSLVLDNIHFSDNFKAIYATIENRSARAARFKTLYLDKPFVPFTVTVSSLEIPAMGSILLRVDLRSRLSPNDYVSLKVIANDGTCAQQVVRIAD